LKCLITANAWQAVHVTLTESITNNTRSPEVFAMASNWISTCLKNHEKCKSASPKPEWYPTRLLDVDPPGLPPDSVCLVETEHEAISEGYMTLSHCWGNLDHLKLTRKTYNTLREGISISRLRQTFQDAIYSVQRLGGRYIWIDALCIFQDTEDLSDWSLEAPRMQDVYSNSVCNISALDAADGSHSLFHTRDTDSLCPPTVQVVAEAEDSNEPWVEMFVLHDFNFWRVQVSEAILHTRAWVVQERLLAPRVLHFGRQQIFWECAEKNAAEVYPDGLPSCIPSRVAKALRPSDQCSRDMETSPYLIWRDIVETYTQCHLTKSEDKLVACSGLARRLAGLMNDSYVVGMWNHGLEFQLLWEVAVDPFTENRQFDDISWPTKYRAPSWSWASLDGPVTLPSSLEGESLIRLEQVFLDYTEHDNYGPVGYGRLQLQGHLKAIRIREPWPATGRIAHTWSLSLLDTRADPEDSDLRPQFILDVMQQDFYAENEQGLLYMMPMALCQSSGNSQYRAMLLQLVDARVAVYCRIGVASWDVTEGNRTKMEEILRQPDEGVERDVPCVYQQDGRYSIVLV
jgi:hypothetical protein